MSGAHLNPAVTIVDALFSGGSEPAERVNPSAVEAMREVGVDLTGERPRRWTDEDLETTDVVVTMGCDGTCPVVPGKPKPAP